MLCASFKVTQQIGTSQREPRLPGPLSLRVYYTSQE